MARPLLSRRIVRRAIASCGALARRLAVFVLALTATVAGTPGSAQAPASACPSSLTAGAHDYHGLTLTRCSFSGLDLSNANFQGATLTAVVFIKANLTGADFSDAVFADSGSATFPNDFSFANLDGASFARARFNGPTYLTYANLPCADFSNARLDGGNAIFGDQPLQLATSGSCRTKFQNATMNCEFVPQWGQLDLTGADISACAGGLQTPPKGRGHDFSGGIYAGVVFDGLDLTGSKWAGAVLERASFQGATLDNATGLAGASSNQMSRLAGAKFNNASVRNVDLSNAQLYGAQFTNADLSNSSLAGSSLQANTKMSPPIEFGAVFDGAHLRDVNLADADLEGTSFQFASFYGSFGGATPQIPCQTNCPAPGFTCACAKASGADLTRANFSSAYLYGVDFTGTTIVNATQFGSAILTGASFAGVHFQVDGGSAPNFTKALLQGTTFDSGANLVNAVFLDAFVDFGTPGSSRTSNDLFLQLSADYTGFRGWQGAVRPCVRTSYATLSAVPSTAVMTCPHGESAVCGDGSTPASLAHWRSRIAMSANAPVAGWYAFATTYDKAGGNPPSCTAADRNW
jgi:uncharacterized protein YjbI with pentapeptide repeats